MTDTWHLETVASVNTGRSRGSLPFARGGVVLRDPHLKVKIARAIGLGFFLSATLAEYDALLCGLEMALADSVPRRTAGGPVCLGSNPLTEDFGQTLTKRGVSFRSMTDASVNPPESKTVVPPSSEVPKDSVNTGIANASESEGILERNRK